MNSSPDRATETLSYVSAALSGLVYLINHEPKMFLQLFGKPDPPEVMQICSGTHLSKRTARRLLRRVDSDRYAEIVSLLLVQSTDYLYHDPIEDLPEMAETFARANADTDAELEGVVRRMGFCHRLWRTKQQILKTKYNIDWLSPGDMNPTVRFD